MTAKPTGSVMGYGGTLETCGVLHSHVIPCAVAHPETVTWGSEPVAEPASTTPPAPRRATRRTGR